MKRSVVNEIIRDSDAFIRSFGYVMPPFAYWSPEKMKQHTASDAPMIRDHMLGWDITDYGLGRFRRNGAVPVHRPQWQSGQCANAAWGCFTPKRS